MILIPLGGIGKRFKDNNYRQPKALINVLGSPIIFHLLDNLKFTNELVYIVYNNEYKKYRFEDLLKKKYPKINFLFLCLKNNTKGAAQTINIALKNLNIPDEPVLCLDGDNFYKCDIIKLWNMKNMIITVEDFNEKPIYSYVLANKNVVKDIVEKEKVSNYACTGAYGFTSYKELLKYTNIILANNITTKNEYYTSLVISEMIKNGKVFNYRIIKKKDWICLGTPIQLRQFCDNQNKNHIKKRICFDLDNTLVTYPKISGDYNTVEPISKNIKYLKYLKKKGNTIIIYTARRMRTHQGNNGKILADIGEVTFNTLKKYDIPFDEIYFGKPYADFYIDDLAINCFEDIEKDIGYYMDKIEPRYFNKIENNSIEIYRKSSKNLDGEIYYYKNIPKIIKKNFPLLIDYDENNTWYSMEKVNGLSVSTLYISELLTIKNLKNIMDAIKNIQNIETSGEKINIYDNYLRKVEKRYKEYDYKKFKDSEIKYNKIRRFLNQYEEEGSGIEKVIHGDCVFTNIILNEYDEIKFIDMRGKVGEVLTIKGDWLYDWSKLYQSLIGYDKILHNKKISKKYENDMIDFFENYFCKLFDKKYLVFLKMITNSMIFSLIPLHDNEKCIEYYNLIN
tara:strand:+ start:6709 stop:8571 length:1863 start_codon:yes stop_codon:yes gene_type:complete